MPNLQKLPAPLYVKVADGNNIVCTEELRCAEWSVQGHNFHSTLRVLPLGSYDMIVGMDWLEAFSPMKVDWLQKWMKIPYGTTHVTLQGLLPQADQSSLFQLCHIAESAASSDDIELLPPVQHLVEEFSDLFQEPTELPPRRHCDHRIPLVPGAPPVAVRQYRYKPALKDEIEK
jgi:hypothetical protein